MNQVNDDKILVVEDDPINRLLMIRLLQKRGFIIHSSKSGNEAIELSKQESFQLILMDLHLHDMNGIEIARFVRNHEGLNQHTPIIAITANSDKKCEDQCYEAGFNDYIIKPVDHACLTHLLKKYQLL